MTATFAVAVQGNSLQGRSLLPIDRLEDDGGPPLSAALFLKRVLVLLPSETTILSHTDWISCNVENLCIQKLSCTDVAPTGENRALGSLGFRDVLCSLFFRFTEKVRRGQKGMKNGLASRGR